MNNESNSGIGFIGMLQIILIFLKLCKIVTWSWWYVLSPFIFSLLCLGLFLTIVFVIIIFKKHE